jgi:peroxiredoxin
MISELNLYGSATCEDTALIRDHLRALGIPFSAHNREDDPRVNDILARWNNGRLVTPTLVFGKGDKSIAEPALEDLDAALCAAGYEFQAPRAVEIRDSRRNERMPNFTLPATNGESITLFKLRGRKRPVLYFAHAAAERVCQGYARQLTNHRELFDEYNALPLLILPDDLETARVWAHEFGRGYPALSDPGGRVKQQYAHALGVEPSNVLLAILDSFCAPRALSDAPEAGGLTNPGEITGWLRLMDCECDE